jgi:hypothetical protein
MCRFGIGVGEVCAVIARGRPADQTLADECRDPRHFPLGHRRHCTSHPLYAHHGGRSKVPRPKTGRRKPVRGRKWADGVTAHAGLRSDIEGHVIAQHKSKYQPSTSQKAHMTSHRSWVARLSHVHRLKYVQGRQRTCPRDYSVKSILHRASISAQT